MATEWVPNFNPGIDHYPKFAIKFYAMCFMPQGYILPQLINFAVTLNGKFFYATKLICDFKSVSLENVSLDLLVSTLISWIVLTVEQRFEIDSFCFWRTRRKQKGNDKCLANFGLSFRHVKNPLFPPSIMTCAFRTQPWIVGLKFGS